MLLGPIACCASHIRPKIRMIGKMGNGVAEASHIAGLAQNSGNAVSHHLRDSADAASHDRDPHGRGLHHNVWPSIHAGAYHHRIAKFQVLASIHKAEKFYFGSEILQLYPSLKRCIERAGPTDQENRVLAL